MTFSNLNDNCSNSLIMRNLQEQVKKAFCYQKLFWHFTVWINCFNDLKIFANSQPSASNFKSFTRSLEQFLLTEDQNNFGNKIPWLLSKFFLDFLNNYNPFNFHVRTVCCHLSGIATSDIRNSSIFLRSTSRVQNNLHTAIK